MKPAPSVVDCGAEDESDDVDVQQIIGLVLLTFLSRCGRRALAHLRQGAKVSGGWAQAQLPDEQKCISETMDVRCDVTFA